MKNFKYYLTGIRKTFLRKKIWIWLWLINLVFGILIVYPLYSIMEGDTAHSLVNDQMLEKASLLWIGDLLYKYQNVQDFLMASVLIPVALYILLNVFLNGGIIAGYAEYGRAINFQGFIQACGKYFTRLFLLFLLSIPLYLIMFAINSGFGAMLKIFTKNASTEWPLIYTSNFKWIFFVLLFSLVNMILDYAKIRLVIPDSRQVLKSFMFSLKLTGRNFFKSWSLYLLNLSGFVIFSVIYLEIENLLPVTSGFMVFIVFVIQQIYIVGRVFIRMNFFGSQIEFYRPRA